MERLSRIAHISQSTSWPRQLFYFSVASNTPSQFPEGGSAWNRPTRSRIKQ